MQNEIICICDKLILKEIVGKVNAAEGFAVLADETTDIATKEQLTLCVRFIDNNNMVNESFLQFVIINSLTGNDLASAIINGLKSCGINCEYLIGQGYDGASNMSGKYKGVQAIVREEYPKAIYVHCAAHTLNLAVSKASNIQPIRNCLSIIEKLYDFFNTPKRNNVLLNCIKNANETPNAKTLKRLCATRWIQRYDAVNDFAELFPFLLFSYGLTLCKQLQKIRIDLKEAVELSNDVIKNLELIRANAEEEFHKLFLQAEVMASVFELELAVKRITKRQANRGNPCSDNANLDVEEYYRITIFIPYLEFFISELTERFFIPFIYF
ncbi:52 kDa repressor of the inhibitor of the protein kinase-like [Myzus persicae]|uniref:52 kDa repressor of the inhibitor of the protein kinase-like n=1 Tax=Myzus persicae TaxID=13164 RepID=UPI000B9327C4|nr:52 kDa repressor of the inhibitor of the protein kinase-like [Myzus persicae]